MPSWNPPTIFLCFSTEKFDTFAANHPLSLKEALPGGPSSRNHATFFAFSRIYAINEKLGFSRKNAKIRRKKCFSRNYASFCRFHEIEHIFRRFHASRTQVDSRNHAKMKSFSWFHASKNPMGGPLKNVFWKVTCTHDQLWNPTVRKIYHVPNWDVSEIDFRI